MRLFSVTFITKDTRLGAALVALEGIAYGKPEITPIRGAKVSGNKVKSSDPDGRTAVEQVAAMINRQRGAEVTRAQIVQWAEQAGSKATNASTMIKWLKDHGILKGKGSGYDGYKVSGR
jgi:hypothetical protein